MGGVNVKNTIVERVLQIIAPHPCSGCGKVGAVLCDDCKYDIISEPFGGCVLCGIPNSSGICVEHNTSISRAFVVSTRADALGDSINRLKFHNVKDAARTLAELLNDTLPVLPKSMIIVPLPTLRSHVRQRGYDQVELLARHLSSLRGMSMAKALGRQTATTQHTEDRATRQKQAAETFFLYPTTLPPGSHVLLIDDIVTTGASISAAADVLAEAGHIVWVACLAYQPLD